MSTFIINGLIMRQQMTDKQNNCKYFDKETGAKMVETFRWYRKVLGLDKEKDKRKRKNNDR